MIAPLRSILILLPLAALAAAKPEGLGFDPAASNWLERVASIYIAPENELFYRMRFPDGHYREFAKRKYFTKEKESIQELTGPGGWRGGIRASCGVIFVESGPDVVGGRAQFLFKNGRLIQFEQNGRVYKFPYELPRKPTQGGEPCYFLDDYLSKKTRVTVEGNGGHKWKHSALHWWHELRYVTFKRLKRVMSLGRNVGDDKSRRSKCIKIWFDMLRFDESGNASIQLDFSSIPKDD